MVLSRLFRREPPPRQAATLYHAVVARGRLPHWYLAGRVPDTIDGRFDMIAAILTMVMLRLEREGAAAAASASLAECFVDDMDGQLRQIGFGDMVVGKHIGRMMAMLGGRIGAYRDGLADNTLGAALVRNLYRGDDPGPDALAHVERELRALRTALDPVTLDHLLAGDVPQ
ncbi:ubiquinol-cytochrome C chaperone [Sphingomonas sp. Leaf407]|uniref:ubiquinol-cytochrome C chaperone family protein n=1 Tax=unclassified Sphingomonas TaxID=196159 RepID=UPI0006F39BD8|nr:MULTISPECIES: ubiquinol-cytochrome C chaperone family protein [unclassified Sphingomonas]KQN35659.1 ubiquinol-cytochrome C chaperone [Sphingomonas sp. Leaf42]KQT26526.1 ubiquinol-cytochrome C chaperone [Sphingomonas sp. Leaf407]